MSNDNNDQDKFNALDAKIHDATHGKNHAKKQQADKDAENKRIGIQAGMELVGAVIAGFLLGLGLDTWLGTKPLFIISFFLLGMITGFYNVYRLTSGHGGAVGFAHIKKTGANGTDKGLSVAEKDAKTRAEIKPPANDVADKDV